MGKGDWWRSGGPETEALPWRMAAEGGGVVEVESWRDLEVLKGGGIIRCFLEGIGETEILTWWAVPRVDNPFPFEMVVSSPFDDGEATPITWDIHSSMWFFNA